MVKKYKRTGKVSKAIKKYVTKALDIHIEDKYLTDALSTDFASVGTTWIEKNLALPTQGTANTQRIGAKIRVKSLEITGVLAGGADESLLDDAFNVMRCVIATYNGGVTTPLGTASASIDEPIIIQTTTSTLKRKYFDRYLHFDVASTEQGAGDGYTPQTKTFKYFKRFPKGLLITFADSSVSFPNTRLIMSMISDSAAVPHPGFVRGFWKISYEDA